MSAPVTPRSLRGIDHCESLLARHLADAMQRFGAAGARVIDLPPLTRAAAVPSQLRVAGVLLWCREVGRGGLPDFVESLAEAVVSGRALLPLVGGAVTRLARYWRAREKRFQRAEREALYARVFGADVSDAAHEGLARLVETLSEVGRAEPHRSTGPLEARAAVQAASLATTLSDRCAGVAAFAARDIVGHVRASLQILGRADVLGPLGARSVAEALRRHGPMVLGRPLDVAAAFGRADAGRELLSWLADRGASGEVTPVRLGHRDRVVRAAEAWRVTETVA